MSSPNNSQHSERRAGACLRRVGLGTLSLLIASAIWLPVVHWCFRRDVGTYFRADGLPGKAQKLAARHLQLWTDPSLRQQELQRMRKSNAEWDFMGRSFLVWSLANMSLRDPAGQADRLKVIDQIIDETLKLERQEGIYFFLMPYAKGRPYVVQPARSLFEDSEIALMLAVRRLVEEKPEYKPLLTERVNAIAERMNNNPHLAVESYPDECWTFDHLVALAATKIADWLDGTDHSALLRAWIAAAKKTLIHRETGLLVSSYTLEGKTMDGPEGSTIWLVAHCLQLIDEDFARDQYERAKKELARNVLGFAYSREWPVGWQGPRDIDSGAVIPVLEISAGGSGLAFVGAASFEDMDYLTALSATLDFAGFPSEKAGRLKYCGSNQVGDAVLLYSTVLGPVWKKVKRGKP